MKHLRIIAFALIFASHPLLASVGNERGIDVIHTTSGGSNLSVPSTGTNLESDSNTDTLTNKTISGASNTISNVNLTSSVTGRLPASNGGAGIWTQEVFTTCNGSTTNFILSNQPYAAGTLQLSEDGVLLAQGVGLDYTISGSTVTLATACEPGQRLLAVYSH